MPLSGNGGSSETVNAKVTIKDTTVSVIVEKDSVQSLTAHLFSPLYKPFEQTGYADSFFCTGQKITISTPQSGSYNLLLTLNRSEMICFLQGLVLGDAADTTVECKLSAPHQVTGRIQPEDHTPSGEQYVLSIFGSPFFAVSDSVSRFSFSGLPQSDLLITATPMAARLFIPKFEYYLAAEQVGMSKLKLLLP